MKTPVRTFSLAGRLRSILWAMLLLPIAAGVAFFLMHSSHVLQREAVAELKADLELQRQFIHMWVNERTEDMNLLASDPRVFTLPAPALRNMLAGLRKSSGDFNNIVAVDEAGRTRADPLREPGIDVSDREYFKAAKAGRSFVSDVLQSRITGAKMFIVAAPVTDSRGRFRGLVMGEVGTNTLSALMKTVQEESSSSTTLLQTNGERIAPAMSSVSSGSARGLEGHDILFQRALSNSPSEGVYRNAAGQRVVGTYLWARGGKWLLAAERRETDIIAVHAGVLSVPMLGAALVFLVFGPAVLRLARSLDAPLKRLEEHARQIEAGNFDVECPALAEKGVPQEVLRLNQAYGLMVERVRGALEALRQAALTDHLTGAANRKQLFSEGPRLLDAARRGGLPVSALMLDLDFFKRVNDTHGHAAGDAVLASFSALLRSTLRKSDLFARYGGEEFVVLAPNAGSASVLELAERIRLAVERLEVPVGEVVLRFTVSIGATSLQGPAGAPNAGVDESVLEGLLARADEALYLAKGEGRNCVRHLPFSSGPAGA